MSVSSSSFWEEDHRLLLGLPLSLDLMVKLITLKIELWLKNILISIDLTTLILFL